MKCPNCGTDLKIVDTETLEAVAAPSDEAKTDDVKEEDAKAEESTDTATDESSGV